MQGHDLRHVAAADEIACCVACLQDSGTGCKQTDFLIFFKDLKSVTESPIALGCSSYTSSLDKKDWSQCRLCSLYFLPFPRALLAEDPWRCQDCNVLGLKRISAGRSTQETRAVVFGWTLRLPVSAVLLKGRACAKDRNARRLKVPTGWRPKWKGLFAALPTPEILRYSTYYKLNPA